MLGVVLNQVFIWPQVLRAVRTAEGIAALTVLGGLLARISRTAYGVVLGDAALVVGNITVATGFLILLIVLVRRHRRPVVLMASGCGVAAVVAVATYADSTVLAWLAVISAALVNLPQMVRAVSNPARLAGVSVSTYLLIAAASACWLTYGVLVHNALISAPHLVLLPTALVTAWLTLVRPTRCVGAMTSAPGLIRVARGHGEGGGGGQKPRVRHSARWGRSAPSVVSAPCPV